VPPAVHDHGFHPLRIARVIRETTDTSSFVLDVPAEMQATFGYAAGQFCNFRLVIDGQPYVRCYSMSSSPDVDAEMQVTVKRVPDGVVSNWMNDNLGPGDVIEVSPPAGFFQLGADDREIVAFSGGSGITPVFSLIKSALATTTRRVRLLYANRDRDAVIFGDVIDALADESGDRLTVAHHLDVERGFVVSETIAPFVDTAANAEFYICGPGPFMDIVERTLLAHDVAAERIHIERFTPAEAEPEPSPSATEATAIRVTIELDGRTETADYRAGTTILQTARQLGMSPPSSCEAGSCATCMAKLIEGAASLRTNNALTADEVADGWVLTCQAEPTTPSVHVVYGYEEG
jgi:3-ketosteroid 9alpha-monooxygenase subunit B